MPRPADLPEFQRPPIDEVAISLPFASIPGFFDAAVGLFWQKIRDTFPNTMVVPGSGVQQVEQFSTDPSSPVGRPPNIPLDRSITVQLNPVSRRWFVSEDDIYVLQVQNGRFGLNWRLRDKPYPRFETLIENFWRYYDLFCELLVESKLPPPLLLQVELDYVNWITDLTMATFLQPKTPTMSAPGIDQLPENQIAIYRFVIRDSEGTPIARLHVDARPAMRMGENAPQFGTQFTLSYHSPVQPDTDRDALNQRFEQGREVIVRSFDDLTSPEAHDRWNEP